MEGTLQNASLDFFQIVLSRGAISDQPRAVSIVLAAASGGKLFIELLPQAGNISFQYRQLGIAVSQANHHIDKVAMLQPH